MVWPQHVNVETEWIRRFTDKKKMVENRCSKLERSFVEVHILRVNSDIVTLSLYIHRQIQWNYFCHSSSKIIFAVKKCIFQTSLILCVNLDAKWCITHVPLLAYIGQFDWICIPGLSCYSVFDISVVWCLKVNHITACTGCRFLCH